MELPKTEIYFYISLWVCGISISLYRLYLVGQVFDHRDHDEYHYEDFKPGWEFLNGRYQDQSDFEWNTWTNLTIKLTPFLLINLIGSELFRQKKAFHLLPLWYTSITTFFILLHYGVNLLMWLLIQTLIYSLFKNHILIWAEEDQYVTMVASCWMVLRCVSYSTDKIKEKFKLSDGVQLLGYSFYLPTMFCGPFIPYSDFHEGIHAKSKLTVVRMLEVFVKFFRCFFWFYFTIFSLHFVYVNAILLRPSFVKDLSDWELAGLGIAMGHFFHLKYVVFYGIPCAWAAAEGFAVPKLPCCVSRVHLYSYMWRWFDHGLYQFLIKYIYIPMIGRTKGSQILRKIIASVSCFAFVFSWHGQHDYVFFWVLFNFIAVTIELITKQLCSLPSVRSILDRNLTPRNQIRVGCFAAAPLHCFSMISNYFFIGNGVEIGFVYFNRIIFGSLQTKVLVWLFLYGAGQSAVATQKWEKEKEEKKKQKPVKKS